MSLVNVDYKLHYGIFSVDTSKEYDKIIKETMRDVVDVLIREVIGLDVVECTLLETKLQVTNEKEADFIFLITTRDGTRLILHVEFQAFNDLDMPYRMLGYWLFIKKVLRLPAKQSSTCFI